MRTSKILLLLLLALSACSQSRPEARPTSALVPPPGTPARTSEPRPNATGESATRSQFSPTVAQAGLPAMPEQLEQAFALIADFLNASPANAQRLEELMQSWRSEPQPGAIEGKLAAEGDLDGDGVPELVAALQQPGNDFSEARQGLLAVFYRAEGGRYKPSVQIYQHVAGLRVLSTADLNQDPRAELVSSSQSCGAHTCVLHVDIWRWSPEGFRNLLAPAPQQPERAGADMASGRASLEDLDGDGNQELIMAGGIIRSLGAGIQRDRREIYAWDGRGFALREVEYDPQASANPYFKLRDGNDAFERGELERALGLYQDALALPFPEQTVIPVSPASRAAVLAFARFRLLLALLLSDQLEQALPLYDQALSSDGAYALWAESFMPEFERTGDIAAGCRKAIVATISRPELLEPLNQFGYANPTFEAKDLCPSGFR